MTKGQVGRVWDPPPPVLINYKHFTTSLRSWFLGSRGLLAASFNLPSPPLFPVDRSWNFGPSPPDSSVRMTSTLLVPLSTLLFHAGEFPWCPSHYLLMPEVRLGRVRAVEAGWESRPVQSRADGKGLSRRSVGGRAGALVDVSFGGREAGEVSARALPSPTRRLPPRRTVEVIPRAQDGLVCEVKERHFLPPLGKGEEL